MKPRYKVVSGHNMCHPETCTCWDWKVIDTEKPYGPSKLCTDNRKQADEYAQNLNEGKVLRWVTP